ncbi:unnamed protein product [Bursaphelenchus okinawaensis]|uniref:C2H2-type domain-containing protein n=1 Tax=Bursaphelenchus okinawaensis TaxID=465554 RepID=A0A811K2H6_9BILA|nr:unnamed protein product [Bursaphelenchus okinawaensis]CAG9090549.1 unnamed protein product [Bursaphelenchus okinawaensis]
MKRNQKPYKNGNCPDHQERQRYVDDVIHNTLARPSQTENRTLFQLKSDPSYNVTTRKEDNVKTYEELQKVPKDVKKEAGVKESRKTAVIEDDDDFNYEEVIKSVVVPKKVPVFQVKPVDIANRKKNQRFRTKKYICDVCDHAFTLKQNVQSHINAYHMSNKKRRGFLRFECLDCHELFNKFLNAKKHYLIVHRQKVKQKKLNECSECGKIYPSGTLLREHIVTKHLCQKPYECQHCGTSFGRKGGLRRHIQMVHENHTYHCPYEDCDHPGYKCSKALAAHIRSVHTKESPYVCNLCGKAFVRHNDLKAHEATHGVGGFGCDYCEKRFSRRKEVERHAQRIHGY